MELHLSDISKILTEDILNAAFKTKTGSDEKIQSIEISRAAPTGEGLISSVYRIRVKSKSYRTSFVVKALVKDPLLRRTLRCAKLFERESIFFTKVLPVFVNIEISLGAKERIQTKIPKCVSCYCDGSNDYILLEDLANAGCNTYAKPTKTQCELAIKTLAHLHSLSFALKQTCPDVFTNMANGIDEVYYVADNKEWYGKFLKRGIEICKQALALHEDPSTSTYYKKFLELTETDVYGELIRLSSSRGKHCVMLHGDSWLQNFLISDKVAVAIDFQLLRCASPAMDLVFLILLSGCLSETKISFMKAAQVYYEALQYHLQDMNLDGKALFSWENLWEEIKTYGKFSFIQIITSIPLTSGPECCDNLGDYAVKYKNVIRIPLEELWKLPPLESEENQKRIVNALHVAVDVGIL